MIEYKYLLSCGWGGNTSVTLVRVEGDVHEYIEYKTGFKNKEEAKKFAEERVKQLSEENGT